MFELLKEGPYVCIHCGYNNNPDIYHFYGTQKKYHSRSPSSALTTLIGDSQSRQSTPRMSKCPQCNELIDEYVQFDYITLYLDAILQKRKFYRHILMNCQIQNRKNACKMALIFYFCEAFHRFTSSNGVKFTENGSDPIPKTYFQLEWVD